VVRVEPGVEVAPAVAAVQAGTAEPVAEPDEAATGVEVEAAPAVAAVQNDTAEPAAVPAGIGVAVEDVPGVVVAVEDAPEAVRPVACSVVGRDVTAVQLDAPAAVRDGCPVAWVCSEAGRDVPAESLAVLAGRV
jgi:hypothetical protein